MALRFGFKKNPFRFKLPSMKLGVRGSLFLAFGAIAAMAIVISASASVLLGRLGGMMTDLSGQNIPRLATSLELSAQSASLSTQGQALLASNSEAMLEERSKQMRETQQTAAAKLAEISRLGADKTVIDAMGEISKNIGDMVGSIGSAAKERLDTSALREKEAAELRKAHTAFLTAATLSMLEAQTQLNAVLGSVTIEQKDAMEAARAVDVLGSVITDTNLLTADMTAAPRRRTQKL